MVAQDMPSENLSAGEAKLYDRQLRLWGVEAQQKLRTTNVLIAGMSALGAEVAKNIVLTGVYSVTIMDHRKLSKDDLPGQFLCPVDKIGENRASSSLNRLAALNPNVKVSADERNVIGVEDIFFHNFGIVCLIDYPFEVASKIDAACTANRISFLAADCFGSFGYMFSNLGENFKCHTENETLQKDGTITKDIKHHEVSFKTFDLCLPFSKNNENCTLSKKAKQNKVLVLALVKKLVQEKYGDSGSVDSEVLVDTVLEVGAKYGIEENDLPFELLCDAHFDQSKGIAEVCAVVGGVIGQEIIKIASRNHLPFNNFFSYSAIESNATVIEL